MRILAIDPGDVQSGMCVLDGYKPVYFEKLENGALLNWMSMNCSGIDVVIIEMVASYGMAVGKNVFETCVWIGRFTQKTLDAGCFMVDTVYRMDEKMTICHDSRAKDTNIRQALIDRFAQHDKATGKGTKKNPDWFYGFKADIWSAYACGVSWLDMRGENNERNNP